MEMLRGSIQLCTLCTHTCCAISRVEHFWGVEGYQKFSFFFIVAKQSSYLLIFHLLWFNIVLNITPVSLKLNDAYFDPIQELGSHCQCIQLVNKVIVFWPPDFKRNIFCIMKSPAYWTTCHENVNYWLGEVGGGRVARNIYHCTGVHKLHHVSQDKYCYNLRVS